MRVFLRADGSVKMGYGHVIRTFALAQMLSSEFECIFLTHSDTKNLIEQGDIKVIQLPEFKDLNQEVEFIAEEYLTGNEIVVIDGYQFDTGYQDTMRQKGGKLLAIDDIASYFFSADAIINTSEGISKNEYSTAYYTLLFLGSKYCLLRPPFLSAAEKRSESPQRRGEVFINMGGSDPKNYTVQVIKSLILNNCNLPCNIVVGNNYPFLGELNQVLNSSSLLHELHQGVSATYMVNLMERCGKAITSASTVAYEYAAVGGELYLLQTADNQQHVYSYFIKNQLALPWEKFNTNGVSFNQMIEAQRSRIDGKSPDRIRKIFKTMQLDIETGIRRAIDDDLLTYFNWSNEPEVRSNSYSTSPIPLDDHTRWFSQKLKDENTIMYVITYGAKPVSQIRFTISESKAIIGYSVDKDMRNRGMGVITLLKGIKALKTEFPSGIDVIGSVKKNNQASINAFLNLGFDQKESLSEIDSYEFSKQI